MSQQRSTIFANVQLLNAQNGGRRATELHNTNRDAAAGETVNRGERGPTSFSNTSANGQMISLGQPRPDNTRAVNEYIETPVKLQQRPGSTGNIASDKKSQLESKVSSNTLPTVHRLLPLSNDDLLRPGFSPFDDASNKIRPTTLPRRICAPSPGTVKPITTQPTLTFKKDKTDLSPCLDTDTVMCRECGKCKCEACRTPKKLPSKQICDGKYWCSAESIVDQCTCMCCVKAAFYHCKDTDDSNVYADKPCSCSAQRCCARWTCVTVSSLTCLPCLLCYLPARGCLRILESVYAWYYDGSCNCNRSSCQSNQATIGSRSYDESGNTKALVDTQPTKRLLDSPTDC